MSAWKYIGLLAACIAGVAGYAYLDSEVRTVVVTSKFVENVQIRRGRSADRFVLRTDSGELPILSFPVIGYTLGVEEVYAGITPGKAIQVRIGQWPPRLLGENGKSHIFAVY